MCLPPRAENRSLVDPRLKVSHTIRPGNRELVKEVASGIVQAKASSDVANSAGYGGHVPVIEQELATRVIIIQHHPVLLPMQFLYIYMSSSHSVSKKCRNR